MKIKTYEKYSLPDIKKYTVIKYKNNTEDIDEYYIDIISNITKDVIFYNIEYMYNEKNKNLEQQEKIYAQTAITHYLKMILFTSDDLNECLEFLKTFTTANKYNL